MTGEADLKKLIELIIRGGWPGSLGLSQKQAALLPTEYLNAVIDDDVYRIDGIKRDTSKMRLLLRSLARNESTTVTNKTLMKDIKSVDDEEIDSNTVSAYLDIFRRLFITDNQPPFSIHSHQAGGKTAFFRPLAGLRSAKGNIRQFVERPGNAWIFIRGPL